LTMEKKKKINVSRNLRPNIAQFMHSEEYYDGNNISNIESS